MTKTDTELRDISQSISVATQDQVKDQSVKSVSDAIRYVPGVTAVQDEVNREAIVFRGNATAGDFFVDGTQMAYKLIVIYTTQTALKY